MDVDSGLILLAVAPAPKVLANAPGSCCYKSQRRQDCPERLVRQAELPEIDDQIGSAEQPHGSECPVEQVLLLSRYQEREDKNEAYADHEVVLHFTIPLKLGRCSQNYNTQIL